MRFYLVFLVFLFEINLTTQAHDSLKAVNGKVVSMNVYSGKLLNIHPAFPSTSHARAMDINFILKTSGKKYWHQFYQYPDFGVSLSLIDFGNKKTLNQGIGLHPFLNFRYHVTNNLKFNLRTGLGAAYFFKPYNTFFNPNNLVIGSHITAFISLNSILSWQVNPLVSLHFGGAFWHYSNAHYSIPNIGANAVMCNGGISYQIAKEITSVSEHKELNKKIMLNFALGGGLQETEGTTSPQDGPRYPVYYGSAYVSKRLSYKTNIQMGINANYYSDYLRIIINQELFDSHERLNAWKIVVFAGHELMFGRLSFLTQLGINVHYPIREKQVSNDLVNKSFLKRYLSTKIGFNYYLKDTMNPNRINSFVGIGINSIGGTADFPELRLGFNL